MSNCDQMQTICELYNDTLTKLSHLHIMYVSIYGWPMLPKLRILFAKSICAFSIRLVSRHSQHIGILYASHMPTSRTYLKFGVTIDRCQKP